MYQLKQTGLPPEQLPQTNAMIASMLTLRPTIELWRAHRQELTDPWVGPGAGRHTETKGGLVTRRSRTRPRASIGRSNPSQCVVQQPAKARIRERVRTIADI